jgi:hypothetical protein
VKRGDRIIGNGKELIERLGRNDPCPCGSERRFQTVMYARRRFRWVGPRLLPSRLTSRFGAPSAAPIGRDDVCGRAALVVSARVVFIGSDSLIGQTLRVSMI